MRSAGAKDALSDAASVPDDEAGARLDRQAGFDVSAEPEMDAGEAPSRLEVAAVTRGCDSPEHRLTLDFVEPEGHRAASSTRQSVAPVQCPQLKVDNDVHKSERAIAIPLCSSRGAAAVHGRAGWGRRRTAMVGVGSSTGPGVACAEAPVVRTLGRPRRLVESFPELPSRAR
jgi:hypothetical protein